MNVADFLERKLKDGSARSLLHSPWIYRFLSLFQRKETVSTRFAFELARDAYLKRRPVAFTSLFSPPSSSTLWGWCRFPSR